MFFGLRGVLPVLCVQIVDKVRQRNKLVPFLGRAFWRALSFRSTAGAREGTFDGEEREVTPHWLLLLSHT